MKIKLTAVLLICTLLACISGCGGEKISVGADVKIIADDVFIDTHVSVKKEEPTAADAIIAACQDEKIAYTLTNGMFDGFGGLKSTNSDGWLFYINGVIAEVGAQQAKITEGDLIEFRYENYDSAFAQ